MPRDGTLITRRELSLGHVSHFTLLARCKLNCCIGKVINNTAASMSIEFKFSSSKAFAALSVSENLRESRKFSSPGKLSTKLALSDSKLCSETELNVNRPRQCLEIILKRRVKLVIAPCDEFLSFQAAPGAASIINLFDLVMHATKSIRLFL
jgi:hypothetical protein